MSRENSSCYESQCTYQFWDQTQNDTDCERAGLRVQVLVFCDQRDEGVDDSNATENI